jgi:hypothetical protein
MEKATYQVMLRMLVDAKIRSFRSSIFYQKTPPRERFEEHVKKVIEAAVAGEIDLGERNWLDIPASSV